VFVEDGSNDNVIGGSASGAGNLIADNLGNGVHIDSGSAGTLVEGDTIENNMSDGVYINDSANTTVNNCVIEDNASWGILVTSGSSFSFTNDTILNNGLGGVKG
jgi:parallel beta-helix repeat protein